MKEKRQSACAHASKTTLKLLLTPERMIPYLKVESKDERKKGSDSLLFEDLLEGTKLTLLDPIVRKP